MLRRGKKGFLNYLQMVGDLFFLNAAILIAFVIRFGWDIPSTNLSSYFRAAVFISIIALVIFDFYGLYHTVNKLWSEILASLVASLGMTLLLSIATSFLLRIFAYPRSVFFIGFILQIILLGIWRWVAMTVERKIVEPQKVILISTEHSAEALIEKINHSFYQVVGLVTDQAISQPIKNAEYLGFYDDLGAVCSEHPGSVIWVASDVPERIKKAAIKYSFKYNCQVIIVPGVYELMLLNCKTNQVQDTLVFELGTQDLGHAPAKRITDLVIACLLTAITLPMMLIVAILIKLTSPGPVLYRQERITKHGKSFLLYKFRTMIDGAEQKTGPVLSTGDKDNRITKVGSFLRATRLDELPQLFNVIKGDMSIVGPRPERPFFVKQFEQKLPYYKYRHIIKPGITGLAQIAGKYSTSAEDKLRYDLLYIKETSQLFDLKIMLQTIKVVLMRSKTS